MSVKKNKYCEGGEVFCIPLFWVDEEYNAKSKLKKQDENKQFAFGRAIEEQGGAGILVEIFKISGPMTLDYESIVNSDLLFDPIYIFWVGIRKKRWKIVYQTPNYDKYSDSNYANINMVLGDYQNLYLKNVESGLEKKLTKEEARKYEKSIVWHPAQLEPRIVQELEGKRYIHLDSISS